MIGIYLISSLLLILILVFSRTRLVSHLVVWSFMVLQWIFTFHAFRHRDTSELRYFTFDPLALILLAILAILCLPAFYHSHVFFDTRRHTPRQRTIYFSAMLLLIVSLSAAYMSNHLAVTWIFVELTTLSSSALIYHNRNERTLEATWKYLFVCSVSITVVFIGILFLSIALQHEGFNELSYAALINDAPLLNSFWLKLAFLFIFTGFTVKAGLVPMYTVGIDAKDKAPGPAGGLLASVLVNVGFLGIFRVYGVMANTAIAAWANHVLVIGGFLSVFVSAVYILRVKNLKRMLAYSGVEHMGIVMLGVASGGAGYYAAILHLILHSFAKSAMFFHVDQMYRIYHSKSINDIGNYFTYNTPGALVLLVSFFVITAIPPSGMFISEFMIFQTLFASGHIWLLVAVLLMLTLIIWSLGKNIFKMLFIKTVGFRDESLKKIHPVESLSQFILLAVVIYLGLAPPEELVVLIQSATKHLPGAI